MDDRVMRRRGVADAMMDGMAGRNSLCRAFIHTTEPLNCSEAAPKSLKQGHRSSVPQKMHDDFWLERHWMEVRDRGHNGFSAGARVPAS